MNILIDHGGHSDLFHSFYCLFEKRLGGTLYYPIGDDWVKKGFLNRHSSIQNKSEIVSHTEADGFSFTTLEMEPGGPQYVMRGITLERFLEKDFDVIATSIYYNEKPFYALVKTHKPGSIYIRQIANIHEKPLGFCKNILIGAAYSPLDYNLETDPDKGLASIGCKQFTYYPEQYEGYKYRHPTTSKKVICLSRHIAPDDEKAWNFFRSKLEPLGFTFQVYGNQFFKYEEDPRFGNSIPHHLLPSEISKVGFVWYTKPNGGGGYTARQALASGRPLILRRLYSEAHTSIECQLFKHGINCIDLGKITSGSEFDISLFKRWADPENHPKICKQVADTFIEDTKFEETAAKFKKWLETLPKGVVR